MNKEIEQTYNEILTKIKDDINKTQLDIMISANINLVNLYFRIGKVLYDNSVGAINLLIKYLLNYEKHILIKKDFL